MTILITGAGGTVGRALSDAVQSRGLQPVPYDLAQAPPDDYHAMERYILALAPQAVIHLAIASDHRPGGHPPAIINTLWPSELAWITAQHRIPFLFTSTAMVFTDRAIGPFLPQTPPDATEGYGGDKARTEERIRHQNAQAHIVRLGWQIGTAFTGNQMLAFLEKQQIEHGFVRASRRWKPACSFLPDTAKALLQALDLPPDTYHLDGNPAGHSFHAIATALSAQNQNRWTIQADDSFVYDQRLLDPHLKTQPLEVRLPQLVQPSQT